MPPVFRFLQARGEVPGEDMYRTFNMGIGMVLVCGRGAAPELIDALAAAGEQGAVTIGTVRSGTPGVTWRGTAGEP